MAVTPTTLSRGTLGTTSATLYTVPASTTAIVTEIVLANSTAAAVAATVSLAGVILVPAMPVAANSTVVIDIKQPLTAGAVITGSAGSASAIACHIAGAVIA